MGRYLIQLRVHILSRGRRGGCGRIDLRCLVVEPLLECLELELNRLNVLFLARNSTHLNRLALGAHQLVEDGGDLRVQTDRHLGGALRVRRSQLDALELVLERVDLGLNALERLQMVQLGAGLNSSSDYWLNSSSGKLGRT